MIAVGIPIDWIESVYSKDFNVSYFSIAIITSESRILPFTSFRQIWTLQFFNTFYSAQLQPWSYDT